MKSLIVGLLAICINSAIFAQKTVPTDIKVKSLTGEEVSLKEIFSGDKAIVLCLWASWCKPCMNELEAINDISEEWEDDVRVIAVSIDDARAVAKVKSMVSGKNWPFEFYLDTNQELKRALNVASIPFSLVASAEGIEVYRHSGYSAGSEIELIEKALEATK